MSYRRIHVFYSGSVQGVGFRYTTQDLAVGLGLGGWARNLGDGRVEVVCEGEEGKLKTFLDDIEKGFLGRYIRDRHLNWDKPTKEFKGFDIRF